MKLPNYANGSNLSKEGYESKKVIVDFLGLSYNKEVQDGEIIDMLNLNSDNSPCLSQRKPRNKIETTIEPFVAANATNCGCPKRLITKDNKLYVITETGFFYKNSSDEWTKITLEEVDKPRQIVTMSNKIIIFPDKKYFEISTSTMKSLEASWEIASSSVTYGSDYITITTGSDTWASKGFAVGDAIQINGSVDANNISVIVKSFDSANPKKMMIEGTLTPSNGSGSTITKFSRTVPDLEYVCVSNNRLWGVAGNTIHGSKLGDPTNFSFLTTDNYSSYFVDVDSDGSFTGCANFSTHIAFFKDDCIHKLYGAKPSQYQIQTSYCRGVEKGSERSLVAVNDILYYKSRDGIYSYMGSNPEKLSFSLGNDKFQNAIAGTDGSKYYVSMYNKTKKRYEFLVYDISRDLWHKEDDTRVVDFCYSDGILYYIEDGITYESGDTVDIISVNEEDVTERIEWSAELGDFSEYSENTKIYSKISTRIDLDIGSELYIDLKRDYGEWENVYANRAMEKGAINVSFRPVRCNNFSIRLWGKGYAVVHSLVREYLIGSEENVN